MDIIGKLQRRGWIAELHVSGKWTCDNSTIESYLNAAFNPSKVSPADGAFGHKLLHDAARKLGAKVVDLAPVPKGDSGTVY